MKRIILAVIAVFVAWSVMDFVIHGVILKAGYSATASLWRPMEEMKPCVMYLSSLIAVIAFVVVFARFFAKKGIGSGLKYGLWFGIGTGVSMGYGSYSVMPIPYCMALTWFLGTVAETVVGGLILGSIIKE